MDKNLVGHWRELLLSYLDSADRKSGSFHCLHCLPRRPCPTTLGLCHDLRAVCGSGTACHVSGAMIHVPSCCLLWPALANYDITSMKLEV